MRLAAKTALVLIVAICGVLAVYGHYEIERQSERFESELEQAQLSLGRLYRPMVARAWRTRGPAGAMFLVDHTEKTLQQRDLESRLTLRWVWLDEHASAPTAPRIPVSKLEPVLDGEELTTTRIDPTGERRMYSYFPLVVGEDLERPGALEVTASLAPLREFTERTRRRIWVTIATIIGVCAVLTLAVGAVLIGRPVNRLVAAARRIGSGELETRLTSRRRDELGTLVREMNQMAGSLMAAQQRLAAATEERIHAIEQMRHADRLATVGKLASGVAHELGSPLAVVAGRAHLIASGAATGATAVTYAEAIERQAGRMSKIISQLLDFARRRPLAVTREDVRALVTETLSLLGSHAQKHRVTLTAELPDEPVGAPINTAQMQQVLTNLVVNAIYAARDGGTVTVGAAITEATPPAEVAPHAPARTYACIWVRDDGPGIAEEILEHLFEPFFTTRPVGEGTGLGLPVSWGIARDHDGWIDVDSTPGGGACFSVYVPADSP